MIQKPETYRYKRRTCF